MGRIRILIADDHAVLRTGLRMLIGSQREGEVLELVAQGYTNQQIADHLGLSVKTVETYRARLVEKLGLQSRAELVRYALDSGLFGGEAGSTP